MGSIIWITAKEDKHLKGQWLAQGDPQAMFWPLQISLSAPSLELITLAHRLQRACSDVEFSKGAYLIDH